MNRLERILSLPVAKPYRTKSIGPNIQPYLNNEGHVDFSPNDIENPKNWSTGRRWYITVAAVLLVMNATFASSSPSGSLVGIAEHFRVSVEAAGLVVTLFLLGYVAGPLIFAPLSEFYGRRWVFYGSFTAYLMFNILCAFAPNFASLLVGRLLTGIFASAPMTNSPGVLADVWGPVERGLAMAIFVTITFVGPSLGPVVSGFLELKKDWRWNFYVLLWLGGVTEAIMFTIPETLPSAILINKACRIRATGVAEYQGLKAPAEAEGRSLLVLFKVALTRPWRILFDPIAFLVAIYVSLIYILLYMLFTIYPIIFQQKRGWNSGVGELPLLSNTIGACIGSAAFYFISRRDQKKIEAGVLLTPEDRLPAAMLGGIMLSISMFWLAWTGEFNSIHWIVPVIAGTFLAAAIIWITVPYLNYLTDTYLMYTASAMAANTICRSAGGAAAPLFTQYMFDALGVGGAGSLIGGVALLLSPIPFVFYRYGGAIRRRSRFASTNDKNQSDVEKQDGDDQRTVAIRTSTGLSPPPTPEQDSPTREAG